MTDLKDNIKTMSEMKKRIERPDRVVDIVEKIREFNGFLSSKRTRTKNIDSRGNAS